MSRDEFDIQAAELLKRRKRGMEEFHPGLQELLKKFDDAAIDEAVDEGDAIKREVVADYLRREAGK